MSETTKPESEPVYGQSQSGEGAWAIFTRWITERVCGLAEFIGILIGIVGSVRQVILAIGLAFFAGGLGKAFYHAWHGSRWMFLGALVIGLAYPFRFGDRK